MKPTMIDCLNHEIAQKRGQLERATEALVSDVAPAVARTGRATRKSGR